MATETYKVHANDEFYAECEFRPLHEDHANTEKIMKRIYREFSNARYYIIKHPFIYMTIYDSKDNIIGQLKLSEDELNELTYQESCGNGNG